MTEETETQPKTAAKRKRENRYKNAPPSVLSVSLLWSRQPVTNHKALSPCIRPAHQSRACGSGMALHGGAVVRCHYHYHLLMNPEQGSTKLSPPLTPALSETRGKERSPSLTLAL